MSKKDLTSYSTKPQLLYHYQRAHKKLLNEDLFVPKKYNIKFIKFERKLHAEGIDPRAYAYGVIPVLQWFAEKKFNRKSIPVSVFLGDWALDQYKDKCDLDFQTVDEGEMTEGELIQNELIVARYYIAQRKQDPATTFPKCVEELESMLSKEWLELYRADERMVIEIAALDELSDEFGGYYTSYDEI